MEIMVKYYFCYDMIKEKDFLEERVCFNDKDLRDTFLYICKIKHDLLASGFSYGNEHIVSIIIPDKEFMKILVKDFKDIFKERGEK